MKPQLAIFFTALGIYPLAFAEQKNYQFGKSAAPSYTASSQQIDVKDKKIDLKKYNHLELDKSQNDLSNAIQGIDLLLSSDIPAEKKRELYFKKSLISYTIAKSLTIKRKSKVAATPLENKYYKEAEALLVSLVKNEKSSSDLQARCYYLLGLIDFEKENYTGQKEKFLKSFQINQNTTYSPTIALNIAEQYFEEENYPQAVKYYRIKYNEMNNQQKTITKYKLAWSYIGLKNNKTAIDLFKSIINENFDPNFVKDSMRDLALITTMDWNEDELIQFTKASFKSKLIQRDFFFLAFKFYFNKNKNDFKTKLFEECLSYEHTVENRLLLHSYSTTAARKDFASAAFTNSIQRFQTDLIHSKITPTNKEFQEFSKDLENNNEYFIRILTETLTNKLKNTENITQQALREQIHFHIKIHSLYFKSSVILPTLLDLLIDISLDEKNLTWLDEVLQITPSIHDIKNKEKIEYRARKEQLILSEKLVQTNEFSSVQLIPLYDFFIAKYPNDEISLLIYKKRAQEFFSKENYDQAIVYFKKSFELEPNEENYYKLLFSYFSKKDYLTIYKTPFSEKYSSERILNIYKESYLGLAQEAKKENNFSLFENYLNLFFKLSKDIAKNKIVQIEILNFAYENKSKVEFYNYFQKQPESLKKYSEMIPLRLNLIDHFMNLGEFEKCKTLTEPRNDESLTLLHAILISSDKDPLNQEINSSIAQLKSGNKDYLLSILMVSQPQLAINYFKSLPQLNADQKSLLFLSYQISQGSDEPTLTAKDISLLGKPLNYGSKIATTAIELKYNSLEFPKKNIKPNLYGKKLEKLIADIKKLRKEILAQTKDKTLAQQSQIFKIANEKEKAVGQSIQESPLPGGLSEQEIAQYRTELESLTLEYVDQAKEYEKLANVIDEKISESNKNRLQEYLPALDLKKWPLPKENDLKNLPNIYSQNGLTLTLVYLEKLKKNGILTESEYYAYRGYYLILFHQSDFIRKYVKSEWKQFQQEDLILKWERLSSAD